MIKPTEVTSTSCVLPSAEVGRCEFAFYTHWVEIGRWTLLNPLAPVGEYLSSSNWIISAPPKPFLSSYFWQPLLNWTVGGFYLSRLGWENLLNWSVGGTFVLSPIQNDTNWTFYS